MRFPGRRKHKHYFPVHSRDPLLEVAGLDAGAARTHVVGVDQTLVDIDARVPDALIARYELLVGEELASLLRLIRRTEATRLLDSIAPGPDEE